MRKKVLKQAVTLAITCSTLLPMGVTPITQAGELPGYWLESLLVEGRQPEDQFGNTITEQSYYRTGGDVKVIDRNTIERRNYNQLSDALRHIPGVLVKTPGYRGGEYGYTQTHSIVTINGDDRVIVLVDGRRMDNTAGNPVAGNSGSGSKATVDINQIISIDDVENIEVIKGPGASFYGADATGGVINIITRKGGKKANGSIDVATGSWHRHNFRLNYGGSTQNNKLKYFVSLNREVGGDSKYKDGIMDKDYTYVNTRYKDNAVNTRFDYDFDNKRRLTIAYNHMNADDAYPLTAPDRRYIDAENWKRIKDDYFHNDKYGDPNNKGYRNLWYMWAWTGGYNAYNKNNLDITYKFDTSNSMDSFIRFYSQSDRHWGSFGAGDREDSPTPDTAEWIAWAKKNYRSRNHRSWFDQLKNRGIQAQYGKSVGKHDILASWNFDRSKYESTSVRKNLKSSVERTSILGYLQDKIHFTKNWELTPSLRYSHYSTFDEESREGVKSTSGLSSNTITPSLNTQYAFDDNTSVYLGWSQVKRPLRVGDYKRETPAGNGGTLQDEKGNVFTVGLRNKLSDKTTLGLHYDYTDMSNAVARYSVWDKDLKDFKNKWVNAKEKKKSVNFTLQHDFDKHLAFTMSYSHYKDVWKAKDGMTFDPDISFQTGNVNSLINKLRPQNTYTGDLTYVNKNLYAALTGTWYTGCSREAFTSNRAFILDANISYDIKKDISIYASATNLTNQAYQTAYTNYLGMGAWPQPGRAFMIGARFKF